MAIQMNRSESVTARRKSRLARIISVLFLTSAAIGCIFPLIWLADYSLVPSNQLFGKDILVWPNPPFWENYRLALTQGKVPQYTWNSIVFTAISLTLIALFSTMMAYGFKRMRWKASKLFLNLVLLGFMIPIHATLLPNFLTFADLKILDTPFALIIPYVAFGLPQATFILSGFMDTVPLAVEESAIIDGCSIPRLLFTIVLPMLKPALMTVIITAFIGIWNEFIMAATFLSSDRWRTLPFAVYNFSGQYSSNYSAQFAVMMLSAIPSLLIYLIFNKNITKGIAAGSVKG